MTIPRLIDEDDNDQIAMAMVMLLLLLLLSSLEWEMVGVEMVPKDTCSICYYVLYRSGKKRRERKRRQRESIKNGKKLKGKYSRRQTRRIARQKSLGGSARSRI